MTLKLILIITLCAPDLGAMEQAYTRILDYAVVERGVIAPELATVWAAPKMAGRAYLLLQPASRANVYLRVVEGKPAAAGYRPMSTFGWNAVEILVKDPDALAAAIRKGESGFSVVGEPRPLGAGSPIRAMQAVGPAQEVLYLTRIPEGTGHMQPAQTFVDRPFVVILGSRDLSTTQRFMRERLGLVSGNPVPARMTVLNKAFSLDIETTHPLTMARVSPEYSIEIDQYPNNATSRPHAPGELPPAMTMVSFETGSLQSIERMLLAPPQRIKARPYNGRRVGVVRGSDDELIELVEDDAATVR
jgi:catechol 2,3-dioxygenase-like lactoylglutathione lyase family enzyme